MAQGGLHQVDWRPTFDGVRCVCMAQPVWVTGAFDAIVRRIVSKSVPKGGGFSHLALCGWDGSDEGDKIMIHLEELVNGKTQSATPLQLEPSTGP
jgi:hypothetical protein